MNLLKSILKSILSLIFLFPFFCLACIYSAINAMQMDHQFELFKLTEIWKREFRSISVFEVGYPCVQHLWQWKSVSIWFDLFFSDWLLVQQDCPMPIAYIAQDLYLFHKKKGAGLTKFESWTKFSSVKIHIFTQLGCFFIFNQQPVFCLTISKRQWNPSAHFKIDFSHEPGKHQKAWCAAIALADILNCLDGNQLSGS